MTHGELTNNLSFLSALQMLSDLVAESLLTESEADAVRQELKLRLCPTV